MNKSHSQRNLKEGYIVDLKSDTVNGLINYRNWDENPKRIEFKRDNGAGVEYFTPATIKAFGVAGEHYLSAIVTIEVSPHRLKELDRFRDLRFGNDTVFLQVLADGDKPFYYVKGYDDREYFL